MGADTYVSWGYNTPKIWRSKSQGIFGCAGNNSAIIRFERMIVGRTKRPDKLTIGRESFAALQIHNGKLYIWSPAARPDVSIHPFWAIGSGGDWAVGAMRAGATLEQALQIAADLDDGTKPPFSFLEV